MAARLERQKSSKRWLCGCVCPAVADDLEGELASVPSMNGHSTAADKASGMEHGAHVTATSHYDAPHTVDVAPSGSDQDRHAANAEPGPACAAAAGSVAAVMAAKVNSHNKTDSVPVRPAAHPDYKHLLASSHNRVYEDADWDASLAAMQQIQQQNQALALQQLQSSAGQKLNRNSYASANSDVWHDAFSHTMSDASAVSEAEQKEVEQYLAELEMLRGPAPGRELSCTPTCVPDPPLLFAPKEWKYCQVDPRPFSGYWERDPVRSTPFPLPIDHQMGLGKLARSCHESIPGMWLRVEGNQFLLTATPQIIAIPGVMNYHEYYNVDSTPNTWALRRDISLGRSQGQMFMTTDGILIFRVFNMGVFSKTVDSVFEDYMRVEDNGTVIVTQQWCRHIDNKTSCSQYLIGRKTGPNPPSKHKH